MTNTTRLYANDEELLRLQGQLQALRSSPAWPAVDRLLWYLDQKMKDLVVSSIPSAPDIQYARGYVQAIREIPEIIKSLDELAKEYYRRKEAEDKKKQERHPPRSDEGSRSGVGGSGSGGLISS